MLTDDTALHPHRAMFAPVSASQPLPGAFSGDSAAAGGGLVICAITREPDSEPRDYARDYWFDRAAFPSSDLVGVAASMVPASSVWKRVRHVAPGVMHPDGTNLSFWQGGNELREGVHAELVIAPGLVKLRRHDPNRAERARDAVTARREQQDALELIERERRSALMHAPMAFVSSGELALFDLEQPEPEQDSRRSTISAWSSKSRRRMMETIASLDLSPIVSGGLPAMVTLTLPGDWLAVAPDAKTAARRFDNFRRAWADRWGKPTWIWKREFQRRGAPHWHLWLVPPVPMQQMNDFRRWLSRAWTAALFSTAEVAPVVSHSRGCGCSEVCRSYQAGTGLDFAEGLRAYDPKRLAVYFLKESLGGEGKAYQNVAPVEWDGQSVGRFWGYASLESAAVPVTIDPAHSDRLWRVMRHLRESQGTTSERYVPRVNTKTGEIRYRRVRRRSKTRGSAGWVAVNDGANVGGKLGLYLDSLRPRVPEVGMALYAGLRALYGVTDRPTRVLTPESRARLRELVEVPF